MTAPIRDGLLAALPWISLALAVAALALSYREHERRMSRVGFSATGKVKAAGALIAFGAYIAYDHVIDETT